MTHPDDLISVLTDDHRELLQLLTEVEILSGGESLRRALTDHLIVESVRHSVAEEAYLYPVSRRLLPDGDRCAAEALASHRRIESTLMRLEEPDVSDEKFSLLLSLLILDMREHIEDEEERIFPLVAAKVSEPELIALGAKAAKAKTDALRGPNASPQDAPLLHLLLRSGAGLVERAREYLCGQDKAYPETR
ncbi:MAG: hemerythrin domain-containing protein [Actinoallomurus sp.]